MSKYLYFSLISSFVFFEDIISNGNSLLDFPSTSKLLTNNSISPVLIFSLKVSSLLFLIVPVTLITLSFVNALKTLSSLLTTCIVSVLSLKSKNNTPPWSLMFYTQPDTVTLSPTLEIIKSLH